MPLPQDIFKQVLKSAGVELKRLGFTKSGPTARIKCGENVAVLNFQKSSWNSKDEVRFTINLGVWSKYLDHFAPGSTPEHINDVDCHWRERIGQFLEGGEDHWWPITSVTDADALSSTIVRVVRDLAVPALLERITDEGLSKLGGGRVMYFGHLALLKKCGPQKEFEEEVERSKNSVSDSARPLLEQVLASLKSVRF